ncbi:MAG: hypothetical protein M0C28_39475 [Candidatus Moduliflexus flocculans]|nr:hypothetical protein [Candidatus Moduliflexus flocculans]
MTPKQRMAAAMSGALPDRVPVMCQMSVGHMLLGTGIPPSRFWHSAPDFVEGLLAMRSRYGFDGILVSLHGHSPDWESRIERLARGPDGETVRWKSGDETFFPFDDLPVVPAGRAARPPAIRRFRSRLPADPGRVHPRLSGLALLPRSRTGFYDAVASVLGRAGGEFSVHGEVTSPFDYFLDLFGFEEAMVGTVEDPGQRGRGPGKAHRRRRCPGRGAGRPRRGRRQDLLSLRRRRLRLSGLLPDLRPAPRVAASPGPSSPGAPGPTCIPAGTSTTGSSSWPRPAFPGSSASTRRLSAASTWRTPSGASGRRSSSKGTSIPVHVLLAGDTERGPGRLPPPGRPSASPEDASSSVRPARSPRGPRPRMSVSLAEVVEETGAY